MGASGCPGGSGCLGPGWPGRIFLVGASSLWGKISKNVHVIAIFGNSLHTIHKSNSKKYFLRSGKSFNCFDILRATVTQNIKNLLKKFCKSRPDLEPILSTFKF